MEQYSFIVSGTASYCGQDAEQRSSIAAESEYEISDVSGDLENIPTIILPDKNYRVIDGRLYVIRPGSPPSSQP